MDRQTTFSMYVAQELAAECARHGVLKQDLAKAAGFGPQQFSYYQKGQRGLMTVGMVVRACEFLDVNPKDVVGRAYDRLPPKPVNVVEGSDDAEQITLGARQRQRRGSRP